MIFMDKQRNASILSVAAGGFILQQHLPHFRLSKNAEWRRFCEKQKPSIFPRKERKMRILQKSGVIFLNEDQS